MAARVRGDSGVSGCSRDCTEGLVQRGEAVGCDADAMMRGSLVVLALMASACARTSDRPRWPAGTLIDLSHDYSDQTVFWPTAETFRLDTVADGVTPLGYYYAANNFSSSEHGGTHIDAPVHFAKGHWSVEQIPLERLVGDAIVVERDRSVRDATR